MHGLLIGDLNSPAVGTKRKVLLSVFLWVKRNEGRSPSLGATSICINSLNPNPFPDKDEFCRTAFPVDCEQSLFCSKIRGEKEAAHESRASSKAASSARGGRRLPPRALLAASPLARDSCSPTFSPRIFEQKRDCSQPTFPANRYDVWPFNWHWLGIWIVGVSKVPSMHFSKTWNLFSINWR